MHQDLASHAFGGISGKAVAFLRIKGNDGFDQADRADGDQIFRIFVYGLIFFDYMCNGRIPFGNQNVFCLQVTLGMFEYILFLRKESQLEMISRQHLKAHLITVYVNSWVFVLPSEKAENRESQKEKRVDRRRQRRLWFKTTF